jgi:KDO2-lipid IV(A) lauroyltransferase
MPICTSNGDGRYTITITQIDTTDLSFNKADIATLAARYTSAIEAEIRHRPEEWFWLHDRWKRG